MTITANGLLAGIAAGLLLMALFCGPAVFVCTLIPVGLVWCMVLAHRSAVRNQLGWLFRLCAGMIGLVLVAALFGGFLLPVMLVAAVLVGLPMFVYRMSSKERKEDAGSV